MFVPHSLWRPGYGRRAWILSICCLALATTVFIADSLAAQDESVPELAEVELAEADLVEADSDLWSETVDRFQVVVLSRGLLLEPLDDSVELRTIEIIDNDVGIDGEVVDEATLRQRVGDEHAEIVLRLAEMADLERRQLFEMGVVAEAEVEVVEEPDSSEAEDRIERDEARAERRREREERKRRYRDSQVVVGNSLTVDQDEVADEAVVFGGPLKVYGKVEGDAAAIGGSVTVEGEVTGNVVAVAGDVNIEEGAEVLGDAVSVGGNVEIDPDAYVRGQIIEVPFGPNLKVHGLTGLLSGRNWWRDDDFTDYSPGHFIAGSMWKTLGLLLLILFACVVYLVARRPLERVQRRAVAEPWKSGLVGLLTQILFCPLLVLVVLVLVISIIGIPLLFLVPFFILALILVAFLGYSAVAFAIGDFLDHRFNWKISNPYLILVLGVVTIQVWSIIGKMLDFGWGPIWFFGAMFAIFGVLFKYVAWTVGLGAAVLTRFGTAEGWGGSGVAPALPAAPVASEPSPQPEVSGGAVDADQESPKPDEPGEPTEPGW